MTIGLMEMALTTILISLFAAYVIFAYRYARYSPWNATWQGVILEAQKLTLAGTVAFFVVDTAIAGPWPGRNAILIGLLTLLAVEAWGTLIGLLHIQQGREGEKPAPEDAESPHPDIDHRQ